MPDLSTQAIVAFDLETTGVDVFEDRIVTASLVYVSPTGEIISNYEWLADPVIEIPEGASEVHGITTEYARKFGRPAAEVVEQLVGILRYFVEHGVPICVYNGSYDISLLNQECVRHFGMTLEQMLGRPIGPVIDALVIDKKLDRYRRGSRKLTATSEHFGIVLENAHESKADAFATALVVQALWRKHDVLKEPPFDALHDLQVMWHREQADGLRAYLIGEQQKDPEKYPDPIEVDGAWPIRNRF